MAFLTAEWHPLLFSIIPDHIRKVRRLMIHTSPDTLIGKTPLYEPAALERKLGVKSRILLKLESFNLTGSVKDRAALFIINEAEKSGRLREGGTIIEPTSGNTGIALAAIGCSRGYRVIIVMPDSMSVERQRLMTAYGAELVLTPGKEGMAGAVRKAEEIKASASGAIIAGQFDNPVNAEAHYRTTGPEIWEDSSGSVDILVAGVGTGGTITGAGRYLKEKKSQVQLIAVEPDDSPLLSEGKAGPHGIQGIGANFVPSVLDRSIIDEVFRVKTEDAFAAARLLAGTEGILAGISSGAALSAAIAAAGREEGKTVVAVLPDTGMRYLSTELFSHI